MLQYQVRQLARDHVVMKIVPRATPPGLDAVALVREMARQAFGEAVRFEVEIVDAIAPDASGKFQTYRSAVPLASGAGE
jgi:hypothetical protein